MEFNLIFLIEYVFKAKAALKVIFNKYRHVCASLPEAGYSQHVVFTFCSTIIRLKESLVLIYNSRNVIGTVLAFAQYLLQDFQSCTIMQNVRNILPR